VPPSLKWGLGAGFAIAAIDGLATVIGTVAAPNADIVQVLDLLANVVLFSLVGLRVGRATGIVRDAAEGGVLAGFIAGVIGIALAFVNQTTPGLPTVQDIVGVLALNVAMGGVLAWLNGWLGSWAQKSGPASRP